LPDSNSPKDRVTDIILDIAHHRLYKPVLTNSNTPEKRKSLNLHFANKGLDAINIANIFHHISVQANVPAYFKQQAAPIISYTYNSTIASKIFNHRKTLQHLNIDEGCNALKRYAILKDAASRFCIFETTLYLKRVLMIIIL